MSKIVQDNLRCQKIESTFNNKNTIHFNEYIITTYEVDKKKYVFKLKSITIHDDKLTDTLMIIFTYLQDDDSTEELTIITKKDFFIRYKREYRSHRFDNVSYQFCDDFRLKINNMGKSTLLLRVVNNELTIGEVADSDIYSFMPWYVLTITNLRPSGISVTIEKKKPKEDVLADMNYKDFLIKAIDKANEKYNKQLSEYQLEIKDKIIDLIR